MADHGCRFIGLRLVLGRIVALDSVVDHLGLAGRRIELGQKVGVLPAVAVGPPMTEIADDLAFGHRQQVKGAFDDGLREMRMVDVAGRMTEREVDVCGARWSHRTRDVSRRRNAGGRNPGRFKLTCNQTHGLMTDRSNRNQQDDVDLIGLAPFDQRRGQLFPHATL